MYDLPSPDVVKDKSPICVFTKYERPELFPIPTY